MGFVCASLLDPSYLQLSVSCWVLPTCLWPRPFFHPPFAVSSSLPPAPCSLPLLPHPRMQDTNPQLDDASSSSSSTTQPQIAPMDGDSSFQVRMHAWHHARRIGGRVVARGGDWFLPSYKCSLWGQGEYPDWFLGVICCWMKISALQSCMWAACCTDASQRSRIRVSKVLEVT